MTPTITYSIVDIRCWNATESMVCFAVRYFLGIRSHSQNNIHRTKIKQGTIMSRQDTVVRPAKTMMVKRIYDIVKKY